MLFPESMQSSLQSQLELMQGTMDLLLGAQTQSQVEMKIGQIRVTDEQVVRIDSEGTLEVFYRFRV